MQSLSLKTPAFCVGVIFDTNNLSHKHVKLAHVIFLFIENAWSLLYDDNQYLENPTSLQQLCV